ncbi:MAG: MraY family glycosyltransferase [Candidatus Latescibacterota bacterium]|nr:MraY family glycosyltransferase [Candidatus Latescibacterota bacterium]
MTMTFLLPLLAVVALVISSFSVPLVRRLALRLGLVDDPEAGTYKTHAQVTPYGGGISIVLGVLLPSVGALWWILEVRPYLLWEGDQFLSPWSQETLFPLAPLSPTILQLSQTVALLLAALAVFALGLADDWRRLSAGVRLAIQVGVAGVLAWSVPGFRPALTGFSGVDMTIAVIWLVSLTNAFNFLDNMNGLSAGVGAIAIAALASMALASAHLPGAVLGLLVVGGAGGFLLYNFPRASIFMGDAGGLFLGFSSGGLALLVCDRLGEVSWGDDVFVTVLPLLCLSVPIYDLISVVSLRLRRRLPPWHGDTNHISHRLVRQGLGRVDAVLVIFAGTAVTAAAGVVALIHPTWAPVSVSAVLIGMICVAAVDMRRMSQDA